MLSGAKKRRNCEEMHKFTNSVFPYICVQEEIPRAKTSSVPLHHRLRSVAVWPMATTIQHTANNSMQLNTQSAQ